MKVQQAVAEQRTLRQSRRNFDGRRTERESQAERGARVADMIVEVSDEPASLADRSPIDSASSRYPVLVGERSTPWPLASSGRKTPRASACSTQRATWDGSEPVRCASSRARVRPHRSIGNEHGQQPFGLTLFDYHSPDTVRGYGAAPRALPCEQSSQLFDEFRNFRPKMPSGAEV